MREQKYRAWNKKDKHMIYLSHMKMLGEYSCLSFYEMNSHYGVSEYKEYEFMQYIGLKDKKRTKEYPEGQEIYAEDIGVYIDHFGHRRKFTVIYEQSEMMNTGRFDAPIMICGFQLPKNCEIIGNTKEGTNKAYA